MDSLVNSRPLDFIKPDHVPASLIFDFDFVGDKRLSTDIHHGMMSLHREAPDIFWTPRNGGHWMATRMSDVREVMTNPLTFSSVKAVIPRQPDDFDIPAPPQDMDPPHHLRHRLLVLKVLSPKYLRSQQTHARLLMRELLDGLNGRSSCEFKEEIAMQLPIVIFIRMMKLDESRRREFVKLAQDMVNLEDASIRFAAYSAVSAYLEEYIAGKLKNPGDDPASALLSSNVNGEPVSPKLAKDIMFLLFAAGLDTVTIMMTFVMKYLAEHPELQQRLRAHPEQCGIATEELIRRCTFVNQPRRVAQDTELSGVKLRAGDHIVCSLTAASLDDREINDPAKVDLDRPKTAHVAFNVGPHVCIGAPLARMEIKVLLEEWLRRMPDVALAPGFVPSTHGGINMSIDRLDLVW